MRFRSTRNKELDVSFADAILNCVPQDGGLYVPCRTEDLRRWLLYMDEETSFSSIAGTLTSAFINEEFSPIICETIATRAFDFSPEIKQLDDELFFMDLSTGPTGNHRDFGISYLAAAIETIMQYRGGTSIILDVTTGEMGASLANALRGKYHIKAVLVYPKGSLRGLEEKDLVWNGGNIYPVELDGSVQDCYSMVKKVFEDREFIKARGINVANTANIGRLLPQAFFYPFAFSRIKSKVHSDIHYALAAGNYSNVVAGLYAWQFALPLNGFIIPSTDALSVDALGNPILLDSIVPLNERIECDPANPSNLERLEDVFSANELMMKHFIYPRSIKDEEVSFAAKELYKKYGVLADRHTARAYAAVLNRKDVVSDESAIVLINRDHPSLSQDYIRHTVGEVPEMPLGVKKSLLKFNLNKPVITSPEQLFSILCSI